MRYEDFLGQVQHRLELADQAQAVRATRSVLTTLGERIQPGEATDLAAPLPMEIDRFVLLANSGQRFDYDHFVGRVAARAAVGRADAVRYGQVLMAVLAEAVPAGEFDQVRHQLPADYDPLFEVVDHRETAA